MYISREILMVDMPKWLARLQGRLICLRKEANDFHLNERFSSHNLFWTSPYSETLPRGRIDTNRHRCLTRNTYGAFKLQVIKGEIKEQTVLLWSRQAGSFQHIWKITMDGGNFCVGPRPTHNVDSCVLGRDALVLVGLSCFRFEGYFRFRLSWGNLRIRIFFKFLSVLRIINILMQWANSSLVFFLDRVITQRDLTNGKGVPCLLG